jgi:hypothetical protein
MAIVANLVIDQGSDFNSTITVEDTVGNALDLTNYTVRGQVRKTYTSSTSYPFTCSKLTSQGPGKIKIQLSPTQTGTMKAGRYVYDVEIVHTTGTPVIRVVEGQVTVTPRVTR